MDNDLTPEEKSALSVAREVRKLALVLEITNDFLDDKESQRALGLSTVSVFKRTIQVMQNHILAIYGDDVKPVPITKMSADFLGNKEAMADLIKLKNFFELTAINKTSIIQPKENMQKICSAIKQEEIIFVINNPVRPSAPPSTDENSLRK